MTFKEKYSYLFVELKAFGTTFPATFPTTATAEDVIIYALENRDSNLPIVQGVSKRMLADLFSCNNDLNANSL